jgi:hypothetical protein
MQPVRQSRKLFIIYELLKWISTAKGFSDFRNSGNSAMIRLGIL